METTSAAKSYDKAKSSFACKIQFVLIALTNFSHNSCAYGGADDNDINFRMEMINLSQSSVVSV